jgi:hypothetical protein
MWNIPVVSPKRRTFAKLDIHPVGCWIASVRFGADPTLARSNTVESKSKPLAPTRMLVAISTFLVNTAITDPRREVVIPAQSRRAPRGRE